MPSSAPSIKRNYLFNAAYQLLKLLTPLISTPYLSRILSAEGVGYYSYTYSIANVFFLLAILGMENYGVRLIASAGGRRGERTRLFWGAYCSQLLLGFLSLGCYLVFCLTAEATYYPLDLLWSFWIISAMVDISWLFFGMQNFRMPAIRSSLMKLVTVAAIFAFVKQRSDLWIYILIVSAGTLAEQLSLWPFARKYIDAYKPTFREITKHVKPNLMLFVPVIAINCYTTVDKIILGSLSTMEQVGFFEYSEKMSRMPLTLITALGTVSLPRLSQVWRAGDRDSALSFISRSIWVTQFVALAFSFGILGISAEFVPVFFGTGFEECEALMPVLGLIIPAIALTNVIGTHYLLPNHLDSTYTLSVSIAAVVNIIMNFALGSRLGAMGAAVAMVVTEYVVLAVQLHAVKGNLPIRNYLLTCLPFCLCGICMAAFMRLLSVGVTGLLGVSVLAVIFEFVGGALFYLVAIAAWGCLTRDRHFFELVETIGKIVRIKFLLARKDR